MCLPLLGSVTVPPLQNGTGRTPPLLTRCKVSFEHPGIQPRDKITTPKTTRTLRTQQIRATLHGTTKCAWRKKKNRTTRRNAHVRSSWLRTPSSGNPLQLSTRFVRYNRKKCTLEIGRKTRFVPLRSASTTRNFGTVSWMEKIT